MRNRATTKPSTTDSSITRGRRYVLCSYSYRRGTLYEKSAPLFAGANVRGIVRARAKGTRDGFVLKIVPAAADGRVVNTRPCNRRETRKSRNARRRGGTNTGRFDSDRCFHVYALRKTRDNGARRTRTTA